MYARELADRTEAATKEELTALDATALAQAIRSRRVTAWALMTACFARIDATNEKHNALVTLDREAAFARARQADADLAAGRSWGPLHGLPVTIKDAFDTAGLRTTAGHSPYADRVPERDAAAVKKLKDAGAIVIGKTNCAELCADIQTSNEVFGTTSNPWDAERTAGGSSGGEGVALALGFSALGLGSDTAGSIRIPASYCGVYGFKPSAGSVARDGLTPLRGSGDRYADSLTVVGPLARSVRDLKLCHDILTGGVAAASPPIPQSSPKILWTTDFATQPVSDEVAQVLEQSFGRLCAAGVDVAKVHSPVDLRALTRAFARLSLYEFTRKESAPAVYRVAWFVEWLRSLRKGGFASAYRSIKQKQAEHAASLDRFLDAAHCWIIPATPTVAFAHQKRGFPIPFVRAGKAGKIGYFDGSLGFTAPISFLGNPAVVIPVGRTQDGMPVAIQVVGKVGRDGELLDVAAAVADKVGWASV